MSGIVKLDSPEFFKNQNVMSVEDIKGETIEVTKEQLKSLPRLNYDTVSFSEKALSGLKTISREEMMSIAPSFRELNAAYPDKTPYKNLPDDYDVKDHINRAFAAYGMKQYGVGYEYADDKPSIERSRGIREMIIAVRDKGFGEDEIVNIAAKIGKEADEAYKNGGMSKELYQRFNDEIETASNAWVDMLYDRRAALIVDNERHDDYLNGCLTPMTPAELNEYTAQRGEQLKKDEGFDFTEFFNRVIKMRYGSLDAMKLFISMK